MNVNSAQLNAQFLAAVDDAFERYKLEVEASELSSDTKGSYIVHVGQFVRWLSGDFEPGGRLK